MRWQIANMLNFVKNFKIDMVWLGARTTVNPFYVQEVAESLQDSKIHVYIKNPIIPDMDLWYNAIKRMQSYNIKNIGAIHRGFFVERKINYRNKPKWSAVKEFRKKIKGINLICDCSHIAGDSRVVKELVLKSQTLKYDGVMIETHDTPEKALSDSKQQIKPTEFNSFSLMNNFKWLIRNYSADEIQNISRNLGVKDYVAKLLNIKKIKTKDTAKIFLILPFQT